MTNLLRLTDHQRLLVEVNYPLAKFLARAAWEKNREQMELDEVVSVAYQGLVTAALKFDPHAHGMSQETIDNGKAFGAFARTKIVGTIIDWQRSNDHVQRSVRADHKKLTAAGMSQETREKNLEGLMASTGLSLERISYVRRAVILHPISIDEVRFEDRIEGNREFENRQGAGPTHHSNDSPTEATAVETQITNTVASAIQDLPSLHQVIIALRYYSGFELQVIAQQLGVNLSTVREAHAEAVLQLHQAMLHKVRDTH